MARVWECSGQERVDKGNRAESYSSLTARKQGVAKSEELNFHRPS